MAKKSLTLSEELAEKYTLKTACAPWFCVYAQRAIIRPLSREEIGKGSALGKAIKVTQNGIFGARAFELQTRKGLLSAYDIAPQTGGTGWNRYPGADHWEVTRDGETVFRSQNYCFVLRYFLLMFERYCDKPAENLRA